jgi:hypothetical protein
VPSGAFKGRIVALYANSPNTISLKYSDYPYQAWSAEQAILGDSADSPFSACIDSTGNIYLSYIDTNHVLKFRKLTFSGGFWNAGTAATVINIDNSANPFILKDNDGRLWCFFDHHRISVDYRHYVRVKMSSDGGATWGSGPSDLGTQLSSSWVEPNFVSACENFGRLYAVYCSDYSNLLMRICNLSDLTWESEQAMATVSGINDDFDIAASSERKIGVVFTPSIISKVYLKEYDDMAWSGLIEIENAQARSPQLTYLENTPHVIYARHLGNNYYALRHAQKSGDTFSLSDFSQVMGIFDKVFVFNGSAQNQFQDKTAAAANTTSGDIFHSESQGLLDSVNDCLYIGKQGKFYLAAITLSTPGTGGAVVWEYFDGNNWIAFNPHSGAYNFDLSDKLIYFWQDAISAPAAWQLGTVNGISAYWVRARVITGFATNPVGTQIISASKNDDLALVRGEQ